MQKLYRFIKIFFIVILLIINLFHFIGGINELNYITVMDPYFGGGIDFYGTYVGTVFYIAYVSVLMFLIISLSGISVYQMIKQRYGWAIIFALIPNILMLAQDIAYTLIYR